MAERQTEQVHPLGKGLHRQPAQAVLSAVLVTQEQALAKLHACLPDLERAADLAAASLLAGGKLAYAGAGSSGLMALADCLELAGTFGIPREQTPMLFAGGAAALLAMTGGVEDDAAQAMTDVVNAGIGAGDVVLCLAASGSTPYTVAVAIAARSAGARVIGLANTANAPLFDLSDISVLLETGPEVVAGSTRLGAATAQKAALNMILQTAAIELQRRNPQLRMVALQPGAQAQPGQHEAAGQIGAQMQRAPVHPGGAEAAPGLAAPQRARHPRRPMAG